LPKSAGAKFLKGVKRIDLQEWAVEKNNKRYQAVASSQNKNCSDFVHLPIVPCYKTTFLIEEKCGAG
jgi:hypothetical protein